MAGGGASRAAAPTAHAAISKVERRVTTTSDGRTTMRTQRMCREECRSTGGISARDQSSISGEDAGVLRTREFSVEPVTTGSGSCHASVMVLPRGRQRHIELRRLAWLDRDLRPAIRVTSLPDLDRVPSRWELNLHFVGAPAIPTLTVDQHQVVPWLDANPHRAVRIDGSRTSRWRGIGRGRRWWQWRRNGSRRHWAWATSSSSRTLGFYLSVLERLHRVTHGEGVAGLQVQVLDVKAVPREKQLKAVLASLEVQSLERSIEIVRDPGVIAVNEDLRVAWLDLQPHRRIGGIGTLRGRTGIGVRRLRRN